MNGCTVTSPGVSHRRRQEAVDAGKGVAGRNACLREPTAELRHLRGNGLGSRWGVVRPADGDRDAPIGAGFITNAIENEGVELAYIALGDWRLCVRRQFLKEIQSMREVARFGLVLERLPGDREPLLDHLACLADRENVALDGVGVVDVLDAKVPSQSVEDLARERPVGSHCSHAISECLECRHS